jgi:hypothetical protein
MRVEVAGRHFVATYFPFFRVKRNDDFDEWGIRLVDGSVSDLTVIVFDHEKSVQELHENARWLINEFILEEDEMLTPKARKLKQSLMEIFHEQRD